MVETTVPDHAPKSLEQAVALFFRITGLDVRRLPSYTDEKYTLFDASQSPRVRELFGEARVHLVFHEQGDKQRPQALIVDDGQTCRYLPFGNDIEVTDYQSASAAYRDLSRSHGKPRDVQAGMALFREAGLGKDKSGLVLTMDSVFAPEATESAVRYGNTLIDIAATKVGPKTKRILIIGAGAGTEALALAAKTSAKIDAFDINPEAVAVTRLNAKLYGYGDRIRARASDLFSAAEGKYDLILFHAPRAVTKELLARTMPEVQAALTMTALSRDPNRFDLQGELLKRALRDVQAHMGRSTRFLLMSDVGIGKVPGLIPDSLRITQVSAAAPWLESEPVQGEFAIHELKLKR